MPAVKNKKKKRHGKAIPTGRHRTAWAPPVTKRIPRKDHFFFWEKTRGYTPPKTNSAGWKIPFFNRKCILKFCKFFGETMVKQLVVQAMVYRCQTELF